jgi:calcineurin-like phosphoesterase family protein
VEVRSSAARIAGLTGCLRIGYAWRRRTDQRRRERGNHDRKSNSWYLANGWDFVADEMTVTLFGMRIAFSHKPLTSYLYPGTGINIHGHHHNTLHHPEDQVTSRHKLVCIEHGYAPVTLQQLLTGTKCV